MLFVVVAIFTVVLIGVIALYEGVVNEHIQRVTLLEHLLRIEQDPTR